MAGNLRHLILSAQFTWKGYKLECHIVFIQYAKYDIKLKNIEMSFRNVKG